ncbi:uncharacterized protein ACIB01_011687 isoform 1-T1 [Guaruba guarouba]
MPSSSFDCHPGLLTGPGIELFGRGTPAWPYLLRQDYKPFMFKDRFRLCIGMQRNSAWLMMLEKLSAIPKEQAVEMSDGKNKQEFQMGQVEKKRDKDGNGKASDSHLIGSPMPSRVTSRPTLCASSCAKQHPLHEVLHYQGLMIEIIRRSKS